jgi:hypothetical protein
MSDLFFSDFELIPDDALNLTPEEEASAYVDPDAFVPAVDEEAGIPFGRTIWMDWDRSQLREDFWVAGVDSVVQVCQLALNVVRGTSLILPDWFGRSNPKDLEGEVDSTELRVLHATDIRDTLLGCHDRVTDVRDFRWTYDPSETVIGFEADVEIDGEVATLVGGTVYVG